MSQVPATTKCRNCHLPLNHHALHGNGALGCPNRSSVFAAVLPVYGMSIGEARRQLFRDYADGKIDSLTKLEDSVTDLIIRAAEQGRKDGEEVAKFDSLPVARPADPASEDREERTEAERQLRAKVDGKGHISRRFASVHAELTGNDLNLLTDGLNQLLGQDPLFGERCSIEDLIQYLQLARQNLD